MTHSILFRFIAPLLNWATIVSGQPPVRNVNYRRAANILLFCFGLYGSCALAADRQPPQPALPLEQEIGETVGRGDPLVLQLRVSGPQEETAGSFLVDTGSAVTILDKSFESLLGKSRGKQRLNLVFAGRAIESVNVYDAPRLYLGKVQLLTGRTVLTSDLGESGANGGCEAILGMDCLKHYCIQMDFAARKMRFLDSDALKPDGLGRAFSMDRKAEIAVASMKLLGDKSLRLVLDTGFYQYGDGMLRSGILRSALQNHPAKNLGRCPGLGREIFCFETIDVGGESYKDLSFADVPIEGGEVEGFIGLSFVRRHVATFDFPKGVLYLRPTERAPEAIKTASGQPSVRKVD
jgi:hypothetical protein